MEKYELGHVLGEGQFGRVYAATVKETGARVAVKLIRVRNLDEGLPHPIARELLLAARLDDSPYLVRTLEVCVRGDCMALVMEYCEADLVTVLRRRCSLAHPLPLARARHYFRMLLLALHHMHRQGILHRDVKPANCFFSSTAAGGGAVLRLGDFGLSRLHRGGSSAEDDMTHEVASRWYRAPELLFGLRRYGAEVDMWSAGCILGELLRGLPDAPLFAGDGDLHQLSKIFDVLGTPNVDGDYAEVAQLPDWNKVRFDPRPGIGLVAILPPQVPPAALDLLSSLLSLNPRRRPSAAQALQHPFFLPSTP